MSPIQTAAIFLIRTAFDLVLLVLMLRFVFQLVRANFLNPICQFVAKVTNPMHMPFQRVLPTIRNINLTTIALLLLIQSTEFYLIGGLSGAGLLNIIGVLVAATGELIQLFVNVYFFAIIISIILSWLSPMGATALGDVAQRISAPIMRPVQKRIPRIGGFDLSPIPVLIGIKLIEILIVTPIIQLGISLS